MLPEQLVGDCANLHHRWGAFEGFDFVGEAADVAGFAVLPVCSSITSTERIRWLNFVG